MRTVTELSFGEVRYAAHKGLERYLASRLHGARDSLKKAVEWFGEGTGDAYGAVGEVAARKALELPLTLENHPAGDDHDGIFFGPFSVDVKTKMSPGGKLLVDRKKLPKIRADLLLLVRPVFRSDRVRVLGKGENPGVSIPTTYEIVGGAKVRSVETWKLVKARFGPAYCIPDGDLLTIDTLTEFFGPPNCGDADDPRKTRKPPKGNAL